MANYPSATNYLSEVVPRRIIRLDQYISISSRKKMAFLTRGELVSICSGGFLGCLFQISVRESKLQISSCKKKGEKAEGFS